LPAIRPIAHDLHGEGHAILTVKTDEGDFVLDNLANDVHPWDATGYYFIKRRSQRNLNAGCRSTCAQMHEPRPAAG